MVRINLEFPLAADCVLDALEVEQCGLVRITGWASPAARFAAEQLVLAVNSRPLTALCMYAYLRPDLAPLAGPDNLWGLAVEYLVPEGTIDSLEIHSPTGAVFSRKDLGLSVRSPHYGNLRGVREVLGRDQIYGSGPPSKVVNEEVKRLTAQLSGSVLDFGCGAGALVAHLRDRGIAAQGIELERLRSDVRDDLLPHVRFYDGRFPLPYAERSFDHVTCIEVLEHVEDFQTAVGEIARVTRRSAMFTVPDISAIPLLQKHNVIPWHLLEGTHVNFFTQLNLEVLLRRCFRNITFARVGRGSVNETRYWTSVVAFASHE